MEWLNIHISTLRSPEFIGSNPTERAAWLCVLAYCVEQENGGRIVGAAAWKCRQWQQACGVMLREIKSADKLLRFIGDDLEVNGFPHAKQAQVQAKRELGSGTSPRKAEAARTNGSLGGRPRKPNEETHQEPTDNPPITHGKPIEGEGKGREGEGKQNPAPPSQGITTWIRTSSSSHERTQENQAALAGLIVRFGAPSVQRISEQLAFQRGGKIWPDDKDLLAQLMAGVAPKTAAIEELPDDLNDLPDGHPMKPRRRINTPIPLGITYMTPLSRK